MDRPADIGALWVAALALAALVATAGGFWQSRPRRQAAVGPVHGHLPCDVLVPVTGALDQQVLATLAAQTHPDYRLLFIVADQQDPANAVVDRICRTHGQARKVCGGTALGCGQKNHNLIAGLRHLRPEAKIVVFCDGTNRADPDWLACFTGPLADNPQRVVTTFRDFDPRPPTLGGCCQAIYGAFMLVLPRLRPSPWGGATALHRDVLEVLNIAEAWADTVVDDVVLGRLLYEKGIALAMDRRHRLDSPLARQSVAGFIAYLERQVLFAKFADPPIWIGMLAWHLNLTLATCWSLAVLAMAVTTGTGPWAGWSATVLLLGEIAFGLALWAVHRHRVPILCWLAALYPALFLGAWVLIRSFFQRRITWHGRCYRVGQGGKVLFPYK